MVNLVLNCALGVLLVQANRLLDRAKSGEVVTRIRIPSHPLPTRPLLHEKAWSEFPKFREVGRAAMLGTALNFASALAGLIAAWRWYQTTTIRPPTELPYGGRPSTRGRSLRLSRRSRG